MLTDVLVVEDSPTQALRLKFVLQKQGLRVFLAGSGREGMAMAPLVLPAAVVLDLHLPDVDGLLVCQALKDHPVMAGIPIIMLTVRDEPADIRAGLEAGAAAYIPKDDLAESELLKTLHELDIL